MRNHIKYSKTMTPASVVRARIILNQQAIRLVLCLFAMLLGGCVMPTMIETCNKACGSAGVKVVTAGRCECK